MTSPFVIRGMLQDMLKTEESRKTRGRLDRRPHFIPLDAASLMVSLASKLVIPKGRTSEDVVAELAKKLADFVNKEASDPNIVSHLRIKRHRITKGRNDTLLVDNTTLLTLDNIDFYTPAGVYSGNTLVGVLTSSEGRGPSTESAFGKLGAALFDKLINKRDFSKYIDSKSADIGHVNITSGPLGVSVSQEQGNRIIGAIDKELLTETDLTRIATLQSVKSNVQALQSSFVAAHDYGTQVENLSLVKDFSPSFIKLGVNIVVVQDTKENRNEWGSREGAFIRDVQKEILNINFSRNFYEEIIYRIVSGIRGLKILPTKAKVDLGEIKRAEGIKYKVTTLANSIGKSRDRSGLRQLRNTRGQFSSLPSLQGLINNRLHDQIRQNMGDGDSRQLLNYRTGRFAHSAAVTHMSRSRNDMITAFYTYMENPYATFSKGGAQQHPVSRDPKLLISRSIHEIAAPIVANRLRAVMV